MKTKLIALAGVFIAIAGFTSCKKCIECSYEFGGETYSSGEICGKKSEVDAVQTQWENAASQTGATASCVKK